MCSVQHWGDSPEVLVRFGRAGLSVGDKYISLVDGDESQAIQVLAGYVAGEGAAAEIWTPSESYLRDGDFRLPRMMSFWEERVGSAFDHGEFEFVRSVGNMSWALGT